MLPPETEPPSVASQKDEDEEALRDIFKLLRSHTGHDFSHYKRITVLRHIARRLQVNQLHQLTAYRDFMRTDPPEAQALLKDLLISVTNFCRDRNAFEDGRRPGARLGWRVVQLARRHIRLPSCCWNTPSDFRLRPRFKSSPLT
jgi:hypothetical protein